jgi:hypothetical protein
MGNATGKKLQRTALRTVAVPVGTGHAMVQRPTPTVQKIVLLHVVMIFVKKVWMKTTRTAL